MQQTLRRQRITPGVPATVVDPDTTHQWTHETNYSQSPGTAHDIESL